MAAIETRFRAALKQVLETFLEDPSPRVVVRATYPWASTRAAPEHQARAAALQLVAIGVLLAAVLVLRPRGLLGEIKAVSRHLD